MINAQDCVPLTEHAQSWLHGQAGASLNACSCSLLMKKELFCVGVLPEHGMTSCSIAILLCRAGSLVGRSGQSLRLLRQPVQVKNIWGTQAAGLAGSGNMAAAANALDSMRVSSCAGLASCPRLPAGGQAIPNSSASAILAWGQIVCSACTYSDSVSLHSIHRLRSPLAPQNLPARLGAPEAQPIEELLLNSCCTSYLTPTGRCPTKRLCTTDMLLQQAPLFAQRGQDSRAPRHALLLALCTASSMGTALQVSRKRAPSFKNALRLFF